MSTSPAGQSSMPLNTSVKSNPAWLTRLVRFDLDLTNRLRLPSTGSPWWTPAAILAHSGDSWIWAVGIGLIWLLRIGGPFWHHYSAILETSIVVQALLVFALKQIIRRERPHGEWGSIYRQYDPHSFPSGHAARAFLLAVLAVHLGPAWFGWLIALWAPLVCISRVLTGVHYVSDILGGIVLGVLMAMVVIAFHPLLFEWFPFLITLP